MKQKRAIDDGIFAGRLAINSDSTCMSWSDTAEQEKLSSLNRAGAKCVEVSSRQ